MASNDAVKIADNITSDFAGNVQYQPDSRFWSTFPKNTANLVSISAIGLHSAHNICAEIPVRVDGDPPLFSGPSLSESGRITTGNVLNEKGPRKGEGQSSQVTEDAARTLNENSKRSVTGPRGTLSCDDIRRGALATLALSRAISPFSQIFSSLRLRSRSSVSGSIGSLKTRRRIAGPSVLSWIAIAFDGGRRGWRSRYSRSSARPAESQTIDRPYRPGRRGPDVWRRCCCSL